MPIMTERDDAVRVLGTKTAQGVISAAAVLRRALARLIVGGPT
jgi:hypothetical protein